MIDADEMNRLVDRGLNQVTALAVIMGELDEERAVAAADERRQVRSWLLEQDTMPAGMEPKWDLAPEHFYLALDGASADDKRAANFVLITADVSEVMANLTFISTRESDAWDEQFRDKSAKTAFRWVKGLPVTPPAIVTFNGKIHIFGGIHRFHLAAECNAITIPLLVDQESLGGVLAILTSARETDRL